MAKGSGLSDLLFLFLPYTGCWLPNQPESMKVQPGNKTVKSLKENQLEYRYLYAKVSEQLRSYQDYRTEETEGDKIQV